MSGFLRRYSRRLSDSRALKKEPVRFLSRSVYLMLAARFSDYIVYRDKQRDFQLSLSSTLLGRGTAGIFVSGRYYEPAFEHLESLLAPGDVAIDCGANVGVYSMAMAAIVGETGRVVAVEPQEYAIRTIRRSAAISGIDSLAIVRAAVSDENGEAELDVSRAAVEASIVWRSSSPRLVRVPKVTIDSLVEQKELPKVTLIKLDVEGAEFDALRGGAGTIERFRPDILLEVWGDSYDRVTPKCADFLKRRGYRFFHFGENGAPCEVEAIDRPYPTLLCRHVAA